MAKTSDILLLAGVGFALMQVKGIFGGFGGLPSLLDDVCLNPLGCGDQEETTKTTTTTKYTCTCSDGFVMESTGTREDCVANCEVTGHGTKETIIGEYYVCPNGSRLPSQNRTYAETCGCPDGFILGNDGRCSRSTIVGTRDIILSRKVACPDGKVIDITGMDAATSEAFIKKQCGLNCPPPYFSINGVCVTKKPTFVPSNIQKSPVNVIYEEEISSGMETFREKDPEPEPELAREWRSEYEF